jgi:adenylate cyclase
MGSLPGPLLHYTFLSNLLQHHLIVELSYLTPLLIVLMALLPFVLILTFKKITHRVFSYTLVYLAVYAFVRYLFVADMIYADLFYPLISLILSVAFVEVLAFNIQEKSDKFLRDTFSSYLSGDLLQELIDNPDSLNLGGEKKELSILFSDIRGFTTISESMSPEELIILLNRYFTPMTKSVLHNKGMLDKYIGDAVMAFFNAPIDVPEHADAVCRCALSMIDKLDKLNKDLAAEGSDVHIKIGVGINTAEVIVGNIGSDDRKEYTVIGDGVNLASRVEGLTKNYGVSILITEFTLQKLSPEFTCREIEHVKVKGKDEAVVLYELMRDNAKEMKKLYDEALEFYKNNDLHNSKMIFSKLVQDYDDNVSKYFLNRIDQGHEWAINKMETK